MKSNLNAPAATADNAAEICRQIQSLVVTSSRMATGASHRASRLARLVPLHLDLQDEMAGYGGRAAMANPSISYLQYPVTRLNCLTWHSTSFILQHTHRITQSRLVYI